MSIIPRNPDAKGALVNCPMPLDKHWSVLTRVRRTGELRTWTARWMPRRRWERSELSLDPTWQVFEVGPFVFVVRPDNL